MFEVLGKLGAGGMADVFLVRAEVSGTRQVVALKRMRLGPEASADAVSRFTREAAFGRLLRHPSVVRVLDAGVDADGPYMALEYVEGMTAFGLVSSQTRKGQTVPLNFASLICRDAAEGLDYAHRLEHDGVVGLLHRDVSPDNVLVGVNGRAKLSDFGIARFEGQTQITTTGEVRGKLAYLAPELFQGLAHSFASDVFAFGATVFRIFGGVPAFRGANDADLMRNVMFVKPPRLRDIRPDVPEGVSDWVEQALSTEPARRPALSALVAELKVPTEAERKELGAWVAERQPATAKTIAALEKVVDPKATPAPVSRPVVDKPAPRRAMPIVVFLLVTLVVFGGVLTAWKLRAAALAPVPDPLPTPVVVQVTPPPEPKPEPPPPPPDPVVVAVAPAESPKAAPAPAKTVHRPKRGSLDVHVTPFADVFVDGDLIGTTPMKPIELAPGTHKVILANTGLNARRTFKVNIEPDKKSRLDADLRAP